MKALLCLVSSIGAAHAAQWRYTDAVSAAHRQILDAAWNDIGQLTRYAYYEALQGPGAVGGKYSRWYPNTDMRWAIEAMWGSFQQVSLTVPFSTTQNGVHYVSTVDFSTVTIDVTTTPLHVNEAITIMNNQNLDSCTIRISRNKLNSPLLASVDTSKFRNDPTAAIESLSGVILHELMHCSQLTKNTIGRNPVNYNYANYPWYIIDVPTADPKNYRGNTYGSYPSYLLNQCGNDAWRNADNHMYFALEAYWKMQPGGQGKLWLSPTKTNYRRDCSKRLLLSDILIGNPDCVVS